MIRDLDDEKLIALICAHYNFFKSLYPDKELTITGLAEEAGMEIPAVSKLVSRLDEKHDILKTRTQPRERGRDRKYVELGEEVKRIIASIIEAVSPISKPKYSASTSMVKTLIKTLTDESIAQNIKKSPAISLRNCCSWQGEIEGGKDELRKFFIVNLKGWKDKEEDDEEKYFIQTEIKIALEYYVAFKLKDEEDIKWMKTVCFPKLICMFKASKNIKKRKRLLKILSRTYMVNELHKKQYELTELIQDRFFDLDEDEGIADGCWDLIWLQADDEEKDELREALLKMVESDDEKTKERGSKYIKKAMAASSHVDVRVTV